MIKSISRRSVTNDKCGQIVKSSITTISHTFDVFDCHGCSTEDNSNIKTAKKTTIVAISHFFMLAPSLRAKVLLTI